MPASAPSGVRDEAGKLAREQLSVRATPCYRCQPGADGLGKLLKGMPMTQSPYIAEDPLYPSSDGQPLAENDWQLRAILDAVAVLDEHFADRPDVYVSGDLLIYYEEGDPSKAVAPDAFVVLGAPNHLRMVYKLWEEPKAPDFVLEVASPGTWKRDAGFKRTLYERLGVREYWRFDPRSELFDPPLQGLTLAAGRYRPIPERLAQGRRVLPSAVLGLELRSEGGLVRFHDPAAGEDLIGLQDVIGGRAAAEARASAAQKRASDAEARASTADERARRLEAQLRKLGVEPEA